MSTVCLLNGRTIHLQRGYPVVQPRMNLSERMLCLAIHTLDRDVGLCLVIWDPISVQHEQLIWVYADTTKAFTAM